MTDRPYLRLVDDPAPSVDEAIGEALREWLAWEKARMAAEALRRIKDESRG